MEERDELKVVDAMKRDRTRDTRVVSNSLTRVYGDATRYHGEALFSAATGGSSLSSWSCNSRICYLQWPSKCPWTGLLLGDMLMPESCSRLNPPHTWKTWETWT